MEIVRQSLIPGVERGDILFSTVKEQPTFRETGSEVELTSEFYYVYEMIRQVYEKKENKDPLLSVVDFNKTIKAVRIPDMFTVSKAEANRELDWPRTTERTVVPWEPEEVEVEPTGLLLEMMKVFPKDYLGWRLFLRGRDTASNNFTVELPSNLSEYFKSMGLSYSESFSNERLPMRGYAKSGPLVKGHLEESISVVNGHRHAHSILRTTAFKGVDSTTTYTPDYTSVTKLDLDVDVAGASKLLFLLGSDYSEETEKQNSAEDLGSLLMTGKMNEMLFLKNMTDSKIKDEVKEQVIRRINNVGRQEVVRFLEQDSLFSNFYILFQNNSNYLLDVVHSGYPNRGISRIDEEFWSSNYIDVSVRQRQIGNFRSYDSRGPIFAAITESIELSEELSKTNLELLIDSIGAVGKSYSIKGYVDHSRTSKEFNLYSY